MFTCIYDILSKTRNSILPRNHFKPHFKASNENTFNNHHRITQGDAFFFFFFFPGCFFEINALRLDMIFLQISTNIPKQFSRLCCIRLSGLVNILRNKCKSPTLPPPTLKHVIVLYFRFKQCNIKKKINYTLLKPFDNRTVTL